MIVILLNVWVRRDLKQGKFKRMEGGRMLLPPLFVLIFGFDKLDLSAVSGYGLINFGINFFSENNVAVFIKAKCEYACGKLPKSLFVEKWISSLKRPR